MQKNFKWGWSFLFIGMIGLMALVPLYQFSTTQSLQNAIFLNPNYPIPARVDDLISRLTLSEKIDMLTSDSPAIPGLDIPELWHENEALHGVIRPGNFTVFPECIMLGATFDPNSENLMASMISDEARAKYNAEDQNTNLLTFFAPNINMARNPLWGRTQETYGEDPFLTSQMAVAYIDGLQGTPYLQPRNYSAELKAAATPKHFAFNNLDSYTFPNGTSENRFSVSVNVDPEWLWNYEFPGFRAAITQAGAENIMASYNEINGVPNCAGSWLLNTVLRQDWGFQGFVVTDCGGIGDLYATQHVVSSYPAACALALENGVDMECGDIFKTYLIQAVDLGLITEQQIDQCLTPILTMWFQLGVFDPPSMSSYANIPLSIVDDDAHNALALKLAEEGIVLLKNNPVNNQIILPFNTNDIHSIAVMGPNANIAEFGDYSGTSNRIPVSPLMGIQTRAAQDNITVNYVPFNYGSNYAADIAAAKTADAVVLVCGLNTTYEDEGNDRETLNLPAFQESYLQTMLAQNPNTVVVLNTGSSIAMSDWIDNCSALLNLWYPGEAGGTALANILFGDVNPSGRLDLTFYNSTSQLASMNDYDMADNQTYLYLQSQPLYPFGYGLSYTNFTYSDLVLNASTININDTLNVSFNVTNTGSREGDEIAQVYLHALDSTNPNIPLEQLKGFQRVSINASNTVQINIPIQITPTNLGLWNDSLNNYQFESGEYQVLVGASSADIRLNSTFTINGVT